MAGTVYVKGLDSITISLKNLHPGQDPHLRAVMTESANDIEKAVKEKASLTDHSLKDLARMGHPYGHGGSPPHPDELVHIQSGKLVESIYSSIMITDTKASVTCGVLESDVPYIKPLIYGTSRMRPRDFLGHAWVEVKPKTIQKIKSGIIAGIKSRTKTGR